MIKRILNFINTKNDVDIEVRCSVDEHKVAEDLFAKIKAGLTQSIIKYGYDTEYVILSTDYDFRILFSEDDISRIRTFNRLRYLITEKTDYDIIYEECPNSKLYGVGDRIVLRKIL